MDKIRRRKVETKRRNRSRGTSYVRKIHPVVVLGPFRLLGVDFIGPLPTSRRGNRFILHIICYFSRFSATFPSKAANASDVIPALEKLFVLYAKPKAIYWDRGQHFFNQEVQDFLTTHNIGFSYSPSGSSNSTGMVEVGNRILEDVIRQGGDWDDNLPTDSRQVGIEDITSFCFVPLK